MIHDGKSLVIERPNGDKAFQPLQTGEFSELQSEHILRLIALCPSDATFYIEQEKK